MTSYLEERTPMGGTLVPEYVLGPPWYLGIEDNRWNSVRGLN
jgi:hypothetical protein